MLSYFRSKIASRRLRREFKECQVILFEVKQKLVDKRTHREQRRPVSSNVSSTTSDHDDREESANTANEADVEDEDESEGEGEEERDGDDEDDAVHSGVSSEEKKQRDTAVPRLGDHFRMKLIIFLNDIRYSCETFAGNSPAAPSSLSSPASGLILEPGTFDRVYGGDGSEVVLGLLDACLLGSNADQLSSSRRSLARRAASIRSTPASGDATIVYDCLVMLEVLLRERKYQTMVAETTTQTKGNKTEKPDKPDKPDTKSPLKKLLQILEAVDDIESKKIVLQTLVHVAETPTNRLHVARAKGPKRILRLLLIKDEDLFYDVMQTLRLFLVVPENTAGQHQQRVVGADAGEEREGEEGEREGKEHRAETKSNSDNAQGSAAADQPDATIGLMSMFRELGKLMPWVEGEGGDTFPSAVGDGNGMDLLGNSNGSNGNGGNGYGGNNNDGASGSVGSGEGTGEDSNNGESGRSGGRGSPRNSENFGNNLDHMRTNYTNHHWSSIDGSRRHNTQKVLGRPTTEQLGQCFKRAKLALKEDPFLNQDQVVGAGLARKKNTTPFSPSNHASYSSTSSLSDSSHLALSTSPESVPNSMRSAGTDSVLFQDFMRSQGTLNILTQMLHQELEEEVVRQEQVLEMLGALQTMLVDSVATNDFATFGGYNILLNIPAKLVSTQLGSRRRLSRRSKSRSDLSVSSEDGGGGDGGGIHSTHDGSEVELTQDDVVVAIEQDLQSFFTAMLRLMVGTSTVTDVNGNKNLKVKTAKDGLLSDAKSLHVVVKLLVESQDQAIVRHAMLCLLDFIKINPLNTTYAQTFGAVHFSLHSVTNIELMPLFTGTPSEWGMRMDSMDNFLRHAAVPLLHVDTTTLKHYITCIKPFLLSIVEGPQHLPIDSWVINHPAMFVELTMKHIGRLLNTVSALIGDAHSAGTQLQMGAVALLLDILGDQLRLLRRWPSLLRWSRGSGNSDNGMFSMDFDHVESNNEDKYSNNKSHNNGPYYENKSSDRPTQETAVCLHNNVMTTLEIIGMLTLSDDEREFAAFEKRQGWRLILNAVRSSIDLSRLAHGVEGTHPVRGQRVTANTPQQPVSELALWLLRELTFASATYEDKPRGGNGIRCILRLLRETWPKVTLNLLDSANSMDPSTSANPPGDMYSESSDDEPDFGIPGSRNPGSNTPILSLRLAVLQLIARLFTTTVPARIFVSRHQKNTPFFRSATGEKTTSNTSTKQRQRTVEEVLILMKISFGKQGGLTQLVDIVCRKPKRRYASITACNAHVAESNSAFHALGEALRNCECNKQQIGSHYGFITLATKLKESLLKLDEKVYDTLMGLAIAEGGSVPSVFRNEQSKMHHMESIRSVSLSLSLLPRVVHMLTPQGMWPFQEPCSRSEFIPHGGSTQMDSRGSPVRSTSSDSSSTLRMHATDSTGDAGHRSKSSPVRLVAHLSNLRQLSTDSSSGSSSSSSSSLRPIISTDTTDGSQKKDPLVAITKRFEEFEAAMNKISAAKQSTDTKHTAATSSVGNSAVVGASSTSNNSLHGTDHFFSSKFRSTEAAVMLIMLLPDAPVSTQTNVLHAILQLIDANPCNARSLCDMQVPMFLLRVAPQLPENVLEKYFQLISRLLSYDVDPDVAVLMFRLSQCDASWIDTAFNNRTEASRELVHHLIRSDFRESNDSNTVDLIQQRNDLQSLVLYILGKNMDRKAPLSYFHFDGTGGALRTQRFERFPVARVGYSCSFWIKNNSFACPEPTLFSWGFPHSNKMVLQLFFMKPRLDLGNHRSSNNKKKTTNNNGIGSMPSSGSNASLNNQYRYLCVRSWPAIEPSTSGSSSDNNSTTSTKLSHLVPVKCFNGHKWTSNEGWHHVVMTQERNEVTLYINGVPIDSTWILPVQLREQSASLYRATLYPGSVSTTSSKSSVTKDKPLCGYVARRADETAGAHNFCGMLGSIRIVEGKWDEAHARSLYANGCQFEGELSDIGVPGKALVFVNAASFADLGRNKTEAGRRSQSSLSIHFKLGRKTADSSGGRSQNANNSSSKTLSHSYTEDRRTAWGSSASSYDSHNFLSPSRFSVVQGGKRGSRHVGSDMSSLSDVDPLQWKSDRESKSGESSLSNLSGNQLSQSLKSPMVNGVSPPLNAMGFRSPERRSLGGRSFYHSESRIGKRRGTSMNDDNSSGDMDDFMLPKGSAGNVIGSVTGVTGRSDKSLVEIEGSVDTHNTSSMQSIVQDMDGLLLVCKFLAIGHMEQVAGLRMISMLLKQNRMNMNTFSSIEVQMDKPDMPQQQTEEIFTTEEQPQQKSGETAPIEDDQQQIVIPGFNVVHYLLVKNKRWWNAEIFDFLFDMVTDHVTSVEKHVELHVEMLAAQKKNGEKRSNTHLNDATMSSQSLMSNQQETLNLLLYCLMELDIKKDTSFVRCVLGTFVEFLGESPRNLPTLRKHTYGQSVEEAKQNVNEGHQKGCGMFFIIHLMVEIIGSAMIRDTQKTMSTTNFHDPRSSAKSSFGSAVTTSSETEYDIGQSQEFTSDKNSPRATSAARHAVLFPVIGLMRSVLLNCNPKQQAESNSNLRNYQLAATIEELRITFDYLISDAQKLPSETAQLAAEFVKIQVIESILGIIGSLQNTKAAWLLDAMRTIPESPWDIPFALLLSKEARLRLAGLKLLDIFLKGAPASRGEPLTIEQRRASLTAQKQFSKMRGFAIVRRMSEEWPVTGAILDALMNLATSPYAPSNGAGNNTNNNTNKGTRNSATSYLIFPEVLHIVLAVLKRCDFDKRHVSARILDEIELLFTPLNQDDTKDDLEDKNRVHTNIEAVLDNKTSPRHWLYWFYDTIKYREERFLFGAQRRWSLGGQEEPDDSLSFHEEGEDSGNASDPSASDGNSTDVSSSTKSPLYRVYMAEEAREKQDQKTLSPVLSPALSLTPLSPLSPMLSPKSEGSGASAAGMSTLSLDSNGTQGTDSSGGFGVYVPLYQIIRRLLLHDMCRSWRKTSSRLFNELLQMASLDESSSTTATTTTTTTDLGGKEGDDTTTTTNSNTTTKLTPPVATPSPILSTPMESAAAVHVSQERDKDNIFHPITFVSSILEDLMDYIETSPQMPLAPSFTAFHATPTAETTTTTHTMRNLVSLFDILTHRIMISEAMQQKQMTKAISEHHLKHKKKNKDKNSTDADADAGLNNMDISFVEKYAPTPELMARAVGAVSALAAQNESVRSKMNETGLLAMQEQLLMRCLSPFMLSSWEWDTRIHPILSMEAVFERAAVSKSFISGHGVLFLVQLFIDMTTIQPMGAAQHVDRHLKQVQTKTVQMLSNVFDASTASLRELIRVVNDSEAIALLLDVFNCSNAILSETQSSSSWWSSTSGTASGTSDASASKTEETKNNTNSKDENNNTHGKTTTGTMGVRRRGHYLNVWVAWINDEKNVGKKEKLRSHIGALLVPIYKTTESTTKRAIKTAVKAIQKHMDRHEKYRKREDDDQREQEDRWNKNRTNSTKRLSDRLREARHAREVSLAKGEKGQSDLKHLDEFYDQELFSSHWDHVGSVDPWELIFAYHEQIETMDA